MIAQGHRRALVFVATKNVMSPGKDFAAYSAAKAAEAQLAKVAALEGAPHGIRSNIVNPDAVFQDSKPLVPRNPARRGRAQGIAVERDRGVLSQAQPARRHHPAGGRVAEAVLFLASDRSAKTTGCTLTVDGGVRDAFRGDGVIGFSAQLDAIRRPSDGRSSSVWRRSAYDRLWTGDRMLRVHNPLNESLTLLASYVPITRRIRLGIAVYLLVAARARGGWRRWRRRSAMPRAGGSSSASASAARTQRVRGCAGCPIRSAGRG